MDTICDFIYDGSFEGFLCTVLRCMNLRVIPATISAGMRSDDMTGLFVDSDILLARRFYSYITKRSSEGAGRMIADLYLTCLPEREMDMYILICRAIRHGAVVEWDYNDGVMKRVQTAVRDLYREAQRISSHMSFARYGMIDISFIRPDNNVLPLIRQNVTRRTELDDFIVFDGSRGMLLMREGDKVTMDTVAAPRITSASDIYRAYRNGNLSR